MQFNKSLKILLLVSVVLSLGYSGKVDANPNRGNNGDNSINPNLYPTRKDCECSNFDYPASPNQSARPDLPQKNCTDSERQYGPAGPTSIRPDLPPKILGDKNSARPDPPPKIWDNVESARPDFPVSKKEQKSSLNKCDNSKNKTVCIYSDNLPKNTKTAIKNFIKNNLGKEVLFISK